MKLLLLLNILSIAAFNLPTIFKEWYCIGFEKNIDKTKPYKFNVGDLPMVSWFDKNNNTLSMIDICPHMGTKLSLGHISKNGNLVCPNHKLEYTQKNVFGETMIYQDKLWWSYEPSEIKPPTMALYNNKKYESILMEVIVNSNVIDCLTNIMNINSFNNPLGYKLNIEPSNINKYKYSYDNYGILFDYILKTNLNKSLKLSENFFYFKYPLTFWYRNSIKLREKSKLEHENIFMNINCLPINIDKTKWYIIVYYNNYDNSSIKKQAIKKAISEMILNNINILANKAEFTLLKKNILSHTKMLINDDQELYNLFKMYNYPDIQSAVNLYNYHRMKNI